MSVDSHAILVFSNAIWVIPVVSKLRIGLPVPALLKRLLCSRPTGKSTKSGSLGETITILSLKHMCNVSLTVIKVR